MKNERQKEYQRKYYIEHRDNILKRSKKWRQNHRKACSEMTARWRKKHPEKAKESWQKGHLKQNYNITPKEVHLLVDKQSNKCAICQKYLERKCIDHDHSDGRIRGILCYNCNTALGHFFDSIEILKNAIEYLKKEDHYGKITD